MLFNLESCCAAGSFPATHCSGWSTTTASGRSSACATRIPRASRRLIVPKKDIMMNSMGYDALDEEWDILGYLEEYWPSWKGPRPDPAPSRRPGVKPGWENKKPPRR